MSNRREFFQSFPDWVRTRWLSRGGPPTQTVSATTQSSDEPIEQPAIPTFPPGKKLSTRWQFSLRTLLVVMLLSAISAAALATFRQRFGLSLKATAFPIFLCAGYLLLSLSLKAMLRFVLTPFRGCFDALLRRIFLSENDQQAEATAPEKQPFNNPQDHE